MVNIWHYETKYMKERRKYQHLQSPWRYLKGLKRQKREDWSKDKVTLEKLSIDKKGKYS